MAREYGTHGVEGKLSTERSAAEVICAKVGHPSARGRIPEPIVELKTAPAPGAPRILIVRLSAMGDLIHGIPVLNALRAALPEAFIGWVAEGRNADLLEGHPALDQLVRAPRHWWQSPQVVMALRRDLRALRFDITLDLQSLTKSAVAAWLSGARRRIGFGGKFGREFSRLLNNELVPSPDDHVVDLYLALLGPLEIAKPEVQWNMPEKEGDASFAESFLRDQRLETARFALLNPAAGWISKRWPASRYGELARYLAQEMQLPSVVVWGLPTERSLARQVVDAGSRTTVLAPPTSMTQLAALARRSAIFIGSDSGPLHLAVAVGAPTLSLHGPTLASQCGAYGSRNRALQVVYDNSRGKRRKSDAWAMEAITAEMVCQACADLLC